MKSAGMRIQTRMGILRVELCCFFFLLGRVYSNTNKVFQPCQDTLVQRGDGFTIGFAFASNDSFFFNSAQLTPCDVRLSLKTKNSQLALFRPIVDQLSLLTINSTTETIEGGYMVAFAGLEFAAISFPQFVFDQTQIITSFTLVLEFHKGRLINLYWKYDGCKSCRGDSSFLCHNEEACAMNIKNCKTRGGNSDCILGIQIAFSGTDKRSSVLKSWYQVNKMHQYSLFGLYDNLKDAYNTF